MQWLFEQCVKCCDGSDIQEDDAMQVEDDKPPVKQAQYKYKTLKIYGTDNLALVRLTSKNFFVDQDFEQGLPIELCEELAMRCGLLGCGTIGVVLNEEQVAMEMCRNNNIVLVILIGSTKLNLTEIKSWSNKIDCIQGSQIRNQLFVDVAIVYISKNDNMDQLIQNARKWAKNQIIIFDKCDDINVTISRMLVYFRAIKIELKQISINGIHKYDCFFFGRIGAHKLFSEILTMTKYLLEDQNDTEQYFEQTEKLIKLLSQKMQPQQLLKKVVQSSQFTCDTMLQQFLNIIIADQLATPQEIFEIYGNQFNQLICQTAQYHQLSEQIQTFQDLDLNNQYQKCQQDKNYISFQNENDLKQQFL